MIQGELVRDKIRGRFPELEVEIIGRSSRGDREQQVPLSTLDGTDFFTREISDALRKGEAEFAVHSLKDMSASHFFSHDAFAIVDRDDVRDLAIFNPSIHQKLRNGEKIIIGTCSPRREEMAIGFLKYALPQFGQSIDIEVRPIRGNVEGRLQQLHEGKFDGTILATAGLNRLLQNEKQDSFTNTVSVRALLQGKPLMLLPLIECVPAPCQGAIVVEADPFNSDAVALLKLINDPVLWMEASLEKKKAYEYGTGCLQKFGVTTIKTSYSGSYLYAAGEDTNGTVFQEWSALPVLTISEEALFSTTDYMKDFFTYQWNEKLPVINQQHVFIANYKALQQDGLADMLQTKTIWASGTKTWKELSRRGIWVQGSADGLGFESLVSVWKMPLFEYDPTSVSVISHEQAAERWKQKGYTAVSNYKLSPLENADIVERISAAKAIFWTSFAQFENYRHCINEHAIHICPGGETASLLKKAGLNPIIFPTIQSFLTWRKRNTISASVV
jgi:hydroxymethylbilane synthase